MKRLICFVLGFAIHVHGQSLGANEECEGNIHGLTCLHILHITCTDLNILWASDAESAVDYAVQLVNQDPYFLPGYYIKVHTKIVPAELVGEALKAFIDSVTEPQVKIGILGPVFSSQTMAVAETAKFYNLVQVGYSSLAPELADKLKYPYYARVRESTALSNSAVLKILEHFLWNNVGVLSNNDVGIAQESKSDMLAKLAANNKTILVAASYTNNPKPALRQVKDSNSRIILSYSYVDGQSNNGILCQIYRLKLMDQRYQWIHWSKSFGVTMELLNSSIAGDCTYSQIKEAVEGFLTFNSKLLTSDQAQQIIGPNGKTIAEIQSGYLKFVAGNYHVYSNRRNITKFQEYAFDAAWSLLMALNLSLAEPIIENIGLENFTYAEEDMARVIYDKLLSIRFQGTRYGVVAFSSKGDRLAPIDIYQIRDGESVLVGEFDALTNSLVWLIDEKTLFKGGKPPLDKELVMMGIHTADNATFVWSTVIALLGSVFAILGCGVSWKYRHTKLIRLSSPRINYIIACGCLMTYISVILWNVTVESKQSQEALCSAKTWCLVCGFTLTFGSMFSKTWRVHRIMHRKRIQKLQILDRHLYMIVAACVCLDIIILTLWHIIDPLKWTENLLDLEADDDMDGVVIQRVMYSCTCSHSGYWTGVLYCYKGVLLIFGIFFAWETRKVRIEGLNDSKEIAISVYNIMIVSILTVPLVNLLSESNGYAVSIITVIGILISATQTLVLVFGLKMVKIFQYGNKVDDLVQLPFQATLSNNTNTTA